MQEHDDQPRGDPHGQGDQQVLQARAVVGRQPRDLERRCLEPAPVAQSGEDQVAAGCRDQPREQHRDQRGAQPDARLHQQHAGRQGAAEQGRDRRERTGRRQHAPLARSHVHEWRDGHPYHRARAISGASGPSTAPNESVASAASATPGPHETGVGSMLTPPSGSWPPSPGSTRRGKDDEGRPDHRQRDHQEPGRARVAEAVGQVVPEHVLELVDHHEESGRHEGGRHPDHGADQNQAQVGRACQRLGVCRARRRRRDGPAPPAAPPPARSTASSGSRGRRTWRSRGRPCPRSPRGPARTRPRRLRAACRPAPS